MVKNPAESDVETKQLACRCSARTASCREQMSRYCHFIELYGFIVLVIPENKEQLVS